MFGVIFFFILPTAIIPLPIIESRGTAHSRVLVLAVVAVDDAIVSCRSIASFGNNGCRCNISWSSSWKQVLLPVLLLLLLLLTDQYYHHAHHGFDTMGTVMASSQCRCYIVTSLLYYIIAHGRRKGRRVSSKISSRIITVLDASAVD